MSIKQNGGVFGRNPTFNDVTIEGQLTFDGDIDINSDLDIDGDLTVDGVVGIKTTSVAYGDLQIGNANSAFSIALAGPRAKLGYDGANVIVQGGTAKGIAFCVNNATLGSGEAARFNTSGNLAFVSGNGIDFSATSGTGTSELLSDYEEGSFIPDVRFGGASPSGITYAARQGTYTKIGNVVEFRFIVTLTAKGSQTGNFEVYGLPYVAASSDNGVGVASFFNNLTFTGEEIPIGRVDNSAVVEFRYPSSGLSTRMTNSQIENTTDLRVSGIYKTA